ncbi:MAG: GNAT family N-acetyltransferase [Mycobacteriales bacterium]
MSTTFATSIHFVEHPTFDARVAASIRQLLVEVDNEFVPPLSCRSSTTTKDFVAVSDSDGPGEYVRQTLSQPCLVAFRDDALAGFMRLHLRHHNSDLNIGDLCTFVRTVVTSHRYRRQGVATQLYETLFKLAPECASPFVATRTWNENTSHIALLEKLGFQQVNRLQDDRGCGIDSLYFARPCALPAGHSTPRSLETEAAKRLAEDCKLGRRLQAAP